MLENTVAESVPADVRRRAATGQWRRGPEVAPLFVTDIERFSTRITDRVVVPRREAEFAGVLAPGIGDTILRDDGSEPWIRQHVHPRRGRHLTVRERDAVLAAIRGESAQSVAEDKITTRQGDRSR